jgi:hypothetical protein
MNRKNQWKLSIGLVVAAAFVVIVYASRNDGDPGKTCEPQRWRSG